MDGKGLEIQRRLVDYLVGRTSLRDLRRWFAPLIAESDQWGDPGARRLAMRLLALLSEADAERWPEKTVREEMTRLLDTSSVTAGSGLVLTARVASVTEARTITLRDAA